MLKCSVLRPSSSSMSMLELVLEVLVVRKVTDSPQHTLFELLDILLHHVCVSPERNAPRTAVPVS